MKPHKRNTLKQLNRAIVAMLEVACALEKYGREDKGKECKGAADMLYEWHKEIENEREIADETNTA